MKGLLLSRQNKKANLPSLFELSGYLWKEQGGTILALYFG